MARQTGQTRLVLYHRQLASRVMVPFGGHAAPQNDILSSFDIRPLPVCISGEMPQD